MLKLTMTIEAKTTSGLEVSLDEVKRKVSNGLRGGGDSNDDENYEFDITGEESSDDVEP